MEMLETSAKSGENVLAAFEKLIGIVHDQAKLIGIVHDRALAASKNRGGIKGMHTASTTTTSQSQQQPIKLDDKAANDNSAAACGC